MITYAEYCGAGGGMAPHRAYYAQFVKASTIDFVVRCIGGQRILESKDIHMSDIPIREWVRIAYFVPMAISFESVGDFSSEAGRVCIAKEAARQWAEKQKDKKEQIT